MQIFRSRWLGALLLGMVLSSLPIKDVTAPNGHPSLGVAFAYTSGDDDDGDSGRGRGRRRGGNDNGGSDNSGHGGGGDDDDDDDNSGPGSGGDDGNSGPGGGGDDEDSGPGGSSVPNGKSGKSEKWVPDDISVIYSNGWTESILSGRYRLVDPRGRVVADRKARREDDFRMRQALEQ